MIKKAIGIAALFLVIFVVAIGIAKANPTSNQPFNNGPQVFTPALPGAEPGIPSQTQPYLNPAAAAPSVRPASQQPEAHPELATSPRPLPERRPSNPKFRPGDQEFSMFHPVYPGGGGAPFKPADVFGPNVFPV